MTGSFFGTPDFFHGVNLIADPVHRYIPITYPLADSKHRGETTERDLIDSPWVQRMRRVHQLQNAMWVYPGAEHSRFTHSLGVMHCAGLFGKTLYSSLANSLAAEGEYCPSLPCVEETLRVAGLTHDLGHGPLCHFFDDQYLRFFGITHEDISHKIIVEELGDVICRLRRSPSGMLEPNEVIEPRNIAFLIKKPATKDEETDTPQWVRWLQPLFCGIFTVDNIDYTLRDAYFCGISPRLIDMERLLFYTFFTKGGMAFHSSGMSALEMFLRSRWYLYNNVYYHRTVRGIDLQLSEIFTDTIRHILNGDPRDSMLDYLALDDHSLASIVKGWRQSDNSDKARLSIAWSGIYERKIQLKRVFERDIKPTEDISPSSGIEPTTEASYIVSLRQKLPMELKEIPFKIDMTSHDTRPVNPVVFKDQRLRVYDPALHETKEVSVDVLFPYMPEFAAKLRIYSPNGMYAKEISDAAQRTPFYYRHENYISNI